MSARDYSDYILTAPQEVRDDLHAAARAALRELEDRGWCVKGTGRAAQELFAALTAYLAVDNNLPQQQDLPHE